MKTKRHKQKSRHHKDYTRQDAKRLPRHTYYEVPKRHTTTTEDAAAAVLHKQAFYHCLIIHNNNTSEQRVLCQQKVTLLSAACECCKPDCYSSCGSYGAQRIRRGSLIHVLMISPLEPNVHVVHVQGHM